MKNFKWYVIEYVNGEPVLDGDNSHKPLMYYKGQPIFELPDNKGFVTKTYHISNIYLTLLGAKRDITKWLGR